MNTKMKAIKNAPQVKTRNSKVEVTPEGLLNLKTILDGIAYNNRTLSPTPAMWLSKATDQVDRAVNKVLVLDRDIDVKHCQIDEATGLFKLWDKVEGGFHCLLKELPNGKTQFVDDNLNPFPHDFDKEMHFLLKDASAEEAYKAEKEAFTKSVQTITVTQISSSLLDESKIQLPTVTGGGMGSQPRKLNLALFFKTLVINGMPEDEEETEEAEAGE